MNRRQRERLIELLSDPEYRHAFAESTLDALIAAQIHANRKARQWHQSELARNAKMHQSQISAMEDVNYGSWTINSLRKMAQAFDLALIVRFESFGNLLRQYVEGFSDDLLVRPPFDRDPGLRPAAIPGAGDANSRGDVFASVGATPLSTIEFSVSG